MNLISKCVAIVLICAGGAALAAKATDPTVKARQELMDTVGMNTKILGEMAGGKTAFDAAAADAAKAALVAAASEIPAKFEPQATDPEAEAKPEIWTNWADFTAKGAALGTAAAAIDSASLDGVKAGMGALGEACKACHSVYRN